MTRLVIGTLLLVAGIGKVSALQPLVLASRFLIPTSLTVALGVVEAVLGLVVLSMSSSCWLWMLLVGLFSVFVGVLLLNSLAGETVCQCFGGSGSSVWLMLAIDLAVIVTLWLFRMHWVSVDGVKVRLGLVADLLPNVKYVIPALLIGAAIKFGSLESAYGYLQGRSLLTDTPVKFVGAIAPEEKATTVFALRNMSSEPIRVLGANASCRCVALDDLPVTIEPHAMREIAVSLYGARTPGLQHETATLICHDSSPSLMLSVSAFVHSNRQAEDANGVSGD